jgi:hypothetical protein
MSDPISVSTALLADLLSLHRLTDRQSTALTRLHLGHADACAELAATTAGLTAVRDRLDNEHALERMALTLRVDGVVP